MAAPSRRELLAGLAATTLAGHQAGARRPRPPHLVLVLADDLGFSDLGCYGGGIPTPTLDGLAADGLRLSDFYSAGRCCPSRAALLTGCYPHSVDMGDMTGDSGLPGYRGRLEPGVQTVADGLRACGYRTLCVGKWHVGDTPQAAPTRRGFDHFYGFVSGGGVYFGLRGDRPLVEDGVVIATETQDLPEGWYSTDAFVDRALEWFEEGVSDEQPVFLYLPLIAPHGPLQAPRELYERFRGQYRHGWDEERARRAQRAISQGVLPPGTLASVRSAEVPAWQRLSPQQQDLADAVMATYAAVVHHMDGALGRLLAGIEDLGQARDTVLIFLSDNGASAESDPVGEMLGAGDWGGRWSRARMGSGWANACNAPFRRFKTQAHEGGIRSPFLLHWPGGLPADRRGQVDPTPAHLVDLLPTLLDLAGAPRRVRRELSRQTPRPGLSLAPLLLGQPLPQRELYWEHEGHQAIRRGSWKAVTETPGRWGLYDLATDPAEVLDLATGFPDELASLMTAWQRWADEVGVRPWKEVAHALLARRALESD